MLVVEEKRKLVFNYADPNEIIKVIPHAKHMVHDGQSLIAVEHGTEESIILRNMGLRDTPAPILTYYDWPGRVTAMAHQKDTAAFLSSNMGALCLNAPGTGKTLSALWAADYLLTEGVIKNVWIIAPLSTLKPVWGTELKQHLPHRSFQIVTGDRKRKQRLMEQAGVQYFITNHDGFTSLVKDLTDVDLVIYDEATALKNPTSQRFRIFHKWMAANDPWLWLMTGTPISQSPVDAWSLARLVGSPTVPRSYVAFRDMVMQKVTTFKWIPRPEALDICKKVLQPSIRFSLDECKDLPETSFIGRQCELSPQQRRAFKDMEETAVAVFSAGTVLAPNAAVLLSKLVQISCGVVYDPTGAAISIDASDRYESLKELIDEIGEKVIVFVPLRGVQNWLEEALRKDGYDLASVHGDVGKAARDKIFHTFQNTSETQVLLAHPKVAAHGLNLTTAKSIVWFAPIYSLEQYEQANARIRRLTTEGRTTIFHIYATPFERELYRRLQLKKRVLADFLELVRGVNDD